MAFKREKDDSKGGNSETEWCKTHNVLPNGAFCSKKYAGMDSQLASALLTQIPKHSSVCDLGAGGGWYTNFFNKNGLTSHAYDASPTRASHVEYLDLTKPWADNRECDWTLCLEVGEHVPSSTNDVFLGNLDKATKDGIILSWAVPGQTGNGHINCQTNDWVIDKMKAKGFDYDAAASHQLRKAAKFHWFKNTIMAFKRE